MCALISGPEAVALGLGSLRTDSGLNQPFVGEIDLVDVRADELDTVRVTLAPPNDFARSGLERFHFLSGLSFTPEVSARGTPVIQVRSSEPIREPFLDFLVEVVWPAGRLVKGYTVLLDPPGLGPRPAVPAPSPQPEAPVPAAVPARGATARTTAAPVSPPPSVAAPPSPPAPVAMTPGADGFPMTFGPVPAGTGLLRLAGSQGPAGATIEQTAMALYRNNQAAFGRGDINLLRAGVTLVIPSRAELFALDPTGAERELQAALQGRPSTREPLTDVAAALTATQVPAVTPIAGLAGEAASRLPAPVETTDAIVAGARDEAPATAAPQETDALRGRVLELEAEVAMLEELLAERDAEVARLQDLVGSAATLGLLGAQPPAPEAVTETAVTEAEVSVTAPEPVADEIAEPAVAADADTVEADEQLAETVPTGVEDAVPSPPLDVAESESVVSEAVIDQDPPAPVVEAPAAIVPEVVAPPARPFWQTYLLPLGAFAAVTAVGVAVFGWLAWRRRRRDTAEPALEEEESFELDLSSPPESPSAAVPTSPATGTGTAARVGAVVAAGPV
ncbi:hypothetical protein CKO25_04065, partial [Thiocapsa imhoffii]|nr:hypothetical protein [Thiocapsa imhoffii]